MFNFISNKINKIDGDDKKLYGYVRLKFNSDVDLSLDELIKFHTLTVIVACVIHKGNKFYPEIYVDKGTYELEQVYCIKMNILKNKFYTIFNNFINIFSFNPKKLSVEKVGSDDLGIYYIYYDEDSFYLVIDDLKEYFEKK